MKFKSISSLLLAFVMAFSMFAGTAFAIELPDSVRSLIERFNTVFAKLDADERGYITAAQQKLGGLSEADRKYVTAPAWDKLRGNPSLDEKAVSDLFMAILSIQYGDVERGLTDAYTGHLSTIREIVQYAGLSMNDVSFQDLADFLSALELNMRGQLQRLSFTDLRNDGVNGTFNKIFSKAYSSVIQSSNPLAVALNNLGVDENVMIAMKDRLASKVDSNSRASYALAVGYIRADAYLAVNSGNSPFEPQLTAMGRRLPNHHPYYQLTWSVEQQVSGSTVTWNGEAFVVSSGTGTAKVAATISILGRSLKIFEDNIIVTGPSSPVVPTPPPAPPAPPAPEQPETPQPIADVIDELDNAVENLDQIVADIDPNAGSEQVSNVVTEIANAVNEAKAKVEQALKETATVKVPVVTDNGVAKAQIEETEIVNQIARVQEQARQLREKLDRLKEAAAAKLNELKDAAGVDLDESIEELADVELDLVVVLDLGTVDSDQAEATLSPAVVAELKQAGISRVAIVVNGASVSVPSSEISSDITVVISKSGVTLASGDVTIAAAQSSYIRTRVAADQYNVKITAQGTEIREFSEPIVISIPLATARGYDTELLTVVSVGDNGEYTYLTGKYNAASNTVDAPVYVIKGPYTVVETKVDFTDLAPVRSWAGKQIEVAAAKGIINGKGDGIYDPTGIVTRAEFAKMIVLAFNLHDASATETFTDVRDGDWFQSYVASAAKYGLMNGKGNGIFDPLAPISRAEMATIAARALKMVNGVKDVSDPAAVLSRFTDGGDVVPSLQSGTALAVRLGLVIGSDGKLDPNGVSTRAAAAVVIYRLINLN